MRVQLFTIFTVAGVVAAGSAAYAINSEALYGHATTNVGVATADLSTNAVVSTKKNPKREGPNPNSSSLSISSPSPTPSATTGVAANPQASSSSGKNQNPHNPSHGNGRKSNTFKGTGKTQGLNGAPSQATQTPAEATPFPTALPPAPKTFPSAASDDGEDDGDYEDNPYQHLDNQPPPPSKPRHRHHDHQQGPDNFR